MDWFASFLSLTGCFLNAKKKRSCWPIWIAANGAWVLYALMTHQPAFIFLNAVYFCLNVYGWQQWSKNL